jgi:hypothetical protein
MKSRLASFFLFILLILAGGANWRVQAALPVNQFYDNFTGHHIKGDFLNTYSRVGDPVRIYGRPITEAFFRQPGGNQMFQYFQKALFILWLDRPAGERVEVVKIGQYLYETKNPVAVIDNFAGCRIYPQTSFPVCFAFLEFFEAFGGVDQFGAPISSIELVNGYKVQYFEKARLEFHPDLPPGRRVIVANLGYEYFLKIGEDPDRITPIPNEAPGASDPIISLQTRAFPLRAVTGLQGKQTVYIVVRDQRGIEVVGAQVVVTIRLPDGQTFEKVIVSEQTNEAGLASFQFNFDSHKDGLAIIDVYVDYKEIKSHTLTSFRIWQ